MTEMKNRDSPADIVTVRTRASLLSRTQRGRSRAATLGQGSRRAGSAADRPAAPDVKAIREQLRPGRLGEFVKSPPGRLLTAALVLAGLSVGAATVTSVTVSDRQQALSILLEDTEPDANSANHLYMSLSIADAAASTAFLAGGLEPPAVRDRYTQSVGEAAAELVTQSGHLPAAVSDDADRALRTGIATSLPVYSGLIETARVNNRNGFPVGAAYLSEASNHMQTAILPMAEELANHRFDAVIEAQHRHVIPPWLAIGLLMCALGALMWAQAELAKRSRRVFNIGLIVGTGALALTVLWTVSAGSWSAIAMLTGRDSGAVPAARLAEARILVQQARAAEMVKLVRRDASGDYDRTFDTDIARLRQLLDGYPAKAPARGEVADGRAALDRWVSAHRRMNERLAAGDYWGASGIATGISAADSAAQVTSLDRALDTASTATRSTMRTNISRAIEALTFLSGGALALGLVTAACIALGVWPRLREYR
ncbi:hypothetical protein [Nocardia camponoti]|uniref:Secreted protein n=1 Tax=Nocardia camponoti TaxID=1616106 RepID=A0A917QIA3_9NOCA|nr:hypothetical protein [Nocardia camponoti]GGK52095.1 hypothetical protein GCM10011591_24720 [Nocardia camponoti]